MFNFFKKKPKYEIYLEDAEINEYFIKITLSNKTYNTIVKDKIFETKEKDLVYDTISNINEDPFGPVMYIMNAPGTTGPLIIQDGNLSIRRQDITTVKITKIVKHPVTLRKIREVK